MEKIIYLFHRKDGVTRDECFDHYRTIHAYLGMRLVKTMAGYTVNLTDVDTPPMGTPDAVTEVWTPSTAASLDPAQSFESREAAAELWTDHKTFLSTEYDTYIVEERTTYGELPPSDEGTRTPGVKCIVFQSPGDDAPELPPSTTCVQENDVVKVVSSGAAPLERITAIWATDADAFGPSTARSVLASEYRFRNPRV